MICLICGRYSRCAGGGFRLLSAAAGVVGNLGFLRGVFHWPAVAVVKVDLFTKPKESLYLLIRTPDHIAFILFCGCCFSSLPFFGVFRRACLYCTRVFILPARFACFLLLHVEQQHTNTVRTARCSGCRRRSEKRSRTRTL